jgi:hypothetical protein
MGLPEAGKTTFLAALWHVLNYGRNTRMKSDKFIGDQTYLANNSKKWANGTKLERTFRSVEQNNLQLQLKSDNDKQIVLSFPDLSGESFQSQWEEREINSQHSDMAQKANSAFLFIHPEKVREEHLISSLGLIDSLGQSSTDSVNEGNIWIHKDAPTQVQLVELLQFLTYIRSGNPLNLIVIISAWDLIKNSERMKKTKIAENWVSERLPLLWQYLKANHEILNVAYYGISALGGEYSDMGSLLDIDDPCKRILVVDPEGNESNDITSPISRILENNG